MMKQSVLLVDDDRNIIDALKRMFHREPYTIYAADSARTALDLLQGISVDVIVVDEQMPGMSGTELLQRIHQQYPALVAIMLTGKANLDVTLQAINKGEIYRFFTKPCNEIELAIAIREALKKAESNVIVANHSRGLNHVKEELDHVEKRLNFPKGEKRF